MRHSGRVAVAFADAAAARVALQALAPDNDGHLMASVAGATLTLSASSPDALGLLRTLDDALACLRALG